MNKIKRLLCSLLIVSIIIATSAQVCIYAAINEDSEYKEYVKLLSELSIMYPFTEDEFRPNDSVTRAEFSVIVTRMLGIGNTRTTDKKFGFADMDENYWAYNSLAHIISLGYMGGYSDGTIKPDNPISFGEALKVLVNTLGYNPIAESKGGYPSGYISVALDIGLLKGVSVSGTVLRKDVAAIIFNALNVDILKASSVGKVTDYKAYPGQTVLTEYLKIYSAEGLVNGKYLTTLSHYSNEIRNNEVMIGGVVYNADSYPTAADYFGFNVTCYYKTDSDGSRTIKSVIPKKNKTLVLDYKQIDSYSNNKIKYAVDNNNYEIELDETPNIIYNGIALSVYDDGILTPESGFAKFIDSDKDDIYETVIITEYNYIIFGRYSKEFSRIYDLIDLSKYVEIENPEKNIYSIIKNEGVTTDVSSLVKGNILKIARSANPNGKILLNIEIEKNTVVGSVSETGDDYYIISGKSYGVTQNCINHINKNLYSIDVGSEGKFYISNDNEVVGFEADALEKVAYLIDAKVQSTISGAIEFKLFANDGKVFVVEGAEKITFDGATVRNRSEILNNLRSAALLTNTNPDYPYSQVIKYKVNSSGVVTYIDTANHNTQLGENDDSLTHDKPFQAPAGSGYTMSRKYVSANQTFYPSSIEDIGRITIGSNTVIFIVPADRSLTDQFQIRQPGTYFKNESNYRIDAYSLDECDAAEAVVSYYNGTQGYTVNQDCSPVIFDKALKMLNAEGEEIMKAFVFSEGKRLEIKTLKHELFEGLNHGDVIRYITDMKGYVVSVGNTGQNGIKTVDINQPQLTERDRNEEADSNTVDASYRHLYGTVYSIKKGFINIVTSLKSDGGVVKTGSNYETLIISPTVPVYVYSRSGKKVSVASVEDITAYRDDPYGCSEVFAYTAGGAIKLIYIINGQ